MDEVKTKAIQDWPEPRKVRDIQSFLGFANFYRRFIYNYSDIFVPLTQLTRKNIKWEFDESCRTSFNNLKAAFTTAPCLIHWQPDQQVILETDASNYAIAGILSHQLEDGSVHPIAFHSQTLSPAELNYDTYDKELLTVYESFKVWCRYLEGCSHSIEVITDHKNLEYFTTTRMLSHHQFCWSEYLAPFNMILRYRPGRLNAKADCLTCRHDVYAKEGGSDYASANPHNFRPLFTSEQLASSLRANYYAAPIARAAIIMDTERLYADITTGQLNNEVSQQKLSDIATPSDAPSSDPSMQWTRIGDGPLLYLGRPYVPNIDDLRLRVLQTFHDHITAGHFGQSKTYNLVSCEFFWPGLRKDIQAFVKSCVTCSRVKAPRHRPYGLLKQLPIPLRPWHSISMDFIEQLPPSSAFTVILVVMDHLSKQVIFIPTDDKVNTPELSKLFVTHMFSKHGVPSHVTSDHGSKFVSHFFRSLGTALDMHLHFTSGFHPEGDGQTEHVNQTLKQYLRVYCNYQQDNWSDLLPLAEFAYNNTPSETTGVSPFYANKGYHPALEVYPERDLASARAHDYAVDLQALHGELKLSMTEAQKQYQRGADRRRNPPPDFTIGDKVFV